MVEIIRIRNIIRKVKLFGVAFVAICFMAGCASNPIVSVFDNNRKIASDTNTYNLINVDQTCEDGHLTASVEKMEGMDTIWNFDTKEDIVIDITYTLNVSSGKIKLVLISSEGEVSIIAECDSELTDSSTINVEKGNNRIKIVADENTNMFGYTLEELSE